MSSFRHPTLRTVILAATGQDVRRCRSCALCSLSPEDCQDISLESLVTMIVMNDDEVLTSRTVWCDDVLAEARTACTGGLDLEAIILALREEAHRREVVESC